MEAVATANEGNSIFDKKLLHPGKHLKSQMKRHDVSIPTVAAAIHISESSLRNILSGKRTISLLMAVRLGYYFGTGHHFWMVIQANYDLSIVMERYKHDIINFIIPLPPLLEEVLPKIKPWRL